MTTQTPTRPAVTNRPAPATGNEHGGDDTRPPNQKRLPRFLKRAAIGLAAFLVLLVAIVTYASIQTNAVIADHVERIETLATVNPVAAYDPAAIGDLPEPAQRYFEYVFVEPQSPMSFVEMTMEGDFRRPLTEGFAPTTAKQTTAVGIPAMIFSGRTSMLPGVWAVMYDAYSEGEMEMKAKVMSTLTVVDYRETPELNQTSLQRWLLESPLYPAALLPGGPVRWEAIDDTHARAIVAADGLEASLVATFRADGSLETFAAEQDGDLTTPYHGSGEHVLRGDYRLVSGMMIPHGFTISRAAGGETYPFWIGEITSIDYQVTG